MAILELNFKSVCLAMQTSVTVILPETDALYHGSIPKYKTLYILHGLSNNHTTYVRNTNIERYATEKGLAVVMPAADHSFYSNMVHGRDFFEFVSTELPHVMKNWFPLSDKKEDTFIAGHSMGGYGAFKVALTFPENSKPRPVCPASWILIISLKKTASKISARVPSRVKWLAKLVRKMIYFIY